MVTETARQTRVNASNGDGEAQDGPTPPMALATVEAIDDALIVSELQGRAVEQWCYSFNQGGTQVTGLTIVGVQAAARQMGRQGEVLRVMDVKTEETEQAVIAHVIVGRYAVSTDGREVLLDTALGTKREAWKKYGRSGWYTDATAFEKAVSKAERNGKAKLLDHSVKAGVLAMALQAAKAIASPDAQAQSRARKSAAKATEGPGPTADADEQRRGFMAAVKERGYDQAETHLRLGLVCLPGRHHDEQKDDKDRCHALSQYVSDLAKPDAEVWRDLTSMIRQGKTITD